VARGAEKAKKKKESAAGVPAREGVFVSCARPARNQLLDCLLGWSGPARVVWRSAASQPPLPVPFPIEGVMGAGAVHNHAPTGLAAVPPRADTPSGRQGRATALRTSSPPPARVRSSPAMDDRSSTDEEEAPGTSTALRARRSGHCPTTRRPTTTTSLATAPPREATASGNDKGDNGGGVAGPVGADLDDDDEVTRLGTAGEDAAIKAGGHLDSARQSAASAVRSATVEVAAAVAACEAAGDAGPVASLRAASALLSKRLASKPVHARSAVLQAVAAVTVPPPRPPAPDEGDEGAAATPANADTRADASARVACRRLCARARHAAGSVLSAVKGLIPMVQPDAGDHAGDDDGHGNGGDAGATARGGGGTRGRQRRCGGCGATGHNVKTRPYHGYRFWSWIFSIRTSWDRVFSLFQTRNVSIGI